MAQTIHDLVIKKQDGHWDLRGLFSGTTVFFGSRSRDPDSAGVPMWQSRQKSTLYYAIPLFLAGLASGYAFVPPSAGSVLVANALGVNLGTMMAVGMSVALVSSQWLQRNYLGEKSWRK